MHPELFSVHGLTEGLTRDTPEIREIEAQGWPDVNVLSKGRPARATPAIGVWSTGLSRPRASKNSNPAYRRSPTV